MTANLLVEAAAAPLTRSGKRWRGILAVPGKGSSGTYSEEVLRRDGPSALAPGAKAFINHDSTRSPKDMIGVYPDGAYYEEGVGLVGELEVFPHWADFVEAVGPHAGLSIYMMGECDEDGNVTSLLPDRMNGVDLVSYPGLEGSGLVEKLYEAAKAHAPAEPSGTPPQENGIIKMDEELKEALKGISDALAVLVAEKTAKVNEAAQIEADEEAARAAVEAYDNAVAAIDAADLLPAQVESLRAEAKAGRDVAPLIEAAKKVKEDAIAAVRVEETATGRSFGAAGETRYGAWA